MPRILLNVKNLNSHFGGGKTLVFGMAFGESPLTALTCISRPKNETGGQKLAFVHS